MLSLLERLKETFEYRPSTGELIRKISPWKIGRHAVGTVAGTKNNYGYICVRFEGKIMKAHRIAWMIHNDVEIDSSIEIDHRDRDRSNNRADNLRLANREENTSNAGKRKDNSTGRKGVSFFKRTGQFKAYVNHKGKHHHVGYFNTVDEAGDAVDAKRKELHGEFANEG